MAREKPKRRKPLAARVGVANDTWLFFRGQAANVTLTVVGDLRSSNGEAMSAIFRNHRDEGPIPGSREIKDRRKRLNAIFDATSDAG